MVHCRILWNGFIIAQMRMVSKEIVGSELFKCMSKYVWHSKQGPLFNKKTSTYWYRDSHYKTEKVYHGDSYTRLPVRRRLFSELIIYCILPRKTSKPKSLTVRELTGGFLSPRACKAKTCPWHDSIMDSLNWYCLCHYSDVMIGTIASQITSLAIVYSTVYSDADQSIVFFQGKHQSLKVWPYVSWPVDFSHHEPVKRKLAHGMTASWILWIDTVSVITVTSWLEQ